jgi:Calcineurin-like phosphoesterase
MKLIAQILGVILLGSLMGGCATPTPHNRDFSFVFIADTQYNKREERAFTNMLAALNQEQFSFIVHGGDFKAGSNAPCTDSLFTRRLVEYQQSENPFIFIPGDNDWVDCQRASNGSQDPLERLAKLRELFYPDDQSIGKRRIPVVRQSAPAALGSTVNSVLMRYPENMRWQKDGVIFFTVNVQGSNDNVGFTAASDTEQRQRETANIAWMHAAFEIAQRENAIGVVMFLQANPGFEEPLAKVAKSAYLPFLRAFEATASVWNKPVIFAHGDTHQFRLLPYESPIDRKRIANVTRLETFGSPHTNWVRVNVRPSNAQAPFEVILGGMGF